MPTVLLVDDSPTVRGMVRAALAALPDVGFVEVGSGSQAIETLAVTTVDMMVLDLNIPDIRGLDVLNFVRSHSVYRDLPVVVLTTGGDDSSRGAALEAGASAYMTKPFSPAALASRAQRLLNPISPP